MSNRRKYRRSAFTLLELMLALSLIVVATALIGSLMQLYASNFATRGEDIRREQLARAVLHMMAEDIRSVVMEQEYDSSVLEQLLGSSGGGSGGGGSGGGGEAAAGDDSGLASAADAGSFESFDFADDSSSSSMAGATAGGDLSETVTTALPPGLYGDQFTLMVDVSRVPRQDEYLPPQAGAVNSTIVDVPGDMKTVTYFVQAATTQGVQDVMANFSQESDATGAAGGLVRRQLDRGVTAYAEEMGDVDRLTRTGSIVAPEVLGVEFAYFDGVEWLFEWDSSTQSLPWLIRITLGMQTAVGSDDAEMAPGTPLSTLSLADRQTYGIEIYELTVAIPGAQLSPADAESADVAAGMSSMGL